MFRSEGSERPPPPAHLPALVAPPRAMPTRPSHAFEEHVGEVRVRVEAPTLAGLFEEAGRAFVELVCGEIPRADGELVHVVLCARDDEALLVALLDELVYRAEVEARVFPELEVVRSDDGRLVTTLRAAEGAPLRTHVKAATFHGLTIARTPSGYSATVVLDV